MIERTSPGDAAFALSSQAELKTWQCVLCGFIYNEAEGMPQDGVPAGTLWANVPDDWVCPDCSATKVDFDMVEV